MLGCRLQVGPAPSLNPVRGLMATDSGAQPRKPSRARAQRFDDLGPFVLRSVIQICWAVQTTSSAQSLWAVHFQISGCDRLCRSDHPNLTLIAAVHSQINGPYSFERSDRPNFNQCGPLDLILSVCFAFCVGAALFFGALWAVGSDINCLYFSALV